MSAPFNTLFLDVATWDLVADASGNIAMAEPSYSIVQDVASACRVFLGEVYYDTTVGVPYLGQIVNGEPAAQNQLQLLGRTPALNILQSALARAALGVPWVAGAEAIISAFVNRQVQGQVQITTESGSTFTVIA
jgi:hypothetical protein